MQTPIQPANKWTIIDILNWTVEYFTSHNIDSPRISGEIFLAHVLNLRRIDLYLRYDQPLTSEELARYKSLIKKRIKREPVAYIMGSRDFWTLSLDVSPHTLIPRPETECLVEMALSHIPDPESGENNKNIYNILDLGTGSGAIILAVASEKPGHNYFATDRSVKALMTAKKNAVKSGMENRVLFLAGNWLDMFKPEPFFNVILSNPPYIPTMVLPTLQPEIFDYEPLVALDGGSDGLESLKQIIDSAHLYLKNQGTLLLEMGYDQKAGLEKIIAESGKYQEIEFFRDYSGNFRNVKLKKKSG